MDNVINNSGLANNLRRAMDERGINGLQLSFKAEVGQARISDLLRGKTANPRVQTVKRIADALGLSVDDLLSSDEVK